MTTNKQKFNKRYGQPLNKSNSKADISKKTGISMNILDKVYDRGLGAHRTNPQSVRPNVRSEEQWAYARVNDFLFAVRRGRFRSGKFDRDLLPSGHPLKTDK